MSVVLPCLCLKPFPTLERAAGKGVKAFLLRCLFSDADEESASLFLALARMVIPCGVIPLSSLYLLALDRIFFPSIYHRPILLNRKLTV